MSTLEVELDRPGRHHGALRIPWSRDRSAYGQLVVPITVLQGAPGPTALLLAGVHGDEYEGQIVLTELARGLDPAVLRGRVLIVPQANPLAAAAGTRCSPEDGGNLARLFPGDPRGGITATLADAITRPLLPLADAVIDLHAGGSSLEYRPCAWGRLPADPAQAHRVLDLLLAFGNGHAAVTARPESTGTLVAAALALGCTAIAAELGGGGTTTPATLAFTRQALTRALTHLGITKGPAPTRDESILAIHPHHFLRAPRAGLFEPAFTLGDTAQAQTHAGWLHSRDHLPEPLLFPATGPIICRRIPTPCDQGDVLTHQASPTTRESLIP